MSASTTLPLIDLSSLKDPSSRSQSIERIKTACKDLGFFRVVNHGISESVTRDAIDTAIKFFELPEEEKMCLASDDIFKPVRYGTNIRNDVKQESYLQRSFLKLYSHPISNWIHLWPANPPDYKEKVGRYVMAVQDLQKQLTDLVLESLGINPNSIQKQIEEGMHVVAVNSYPLSSEPNLTSGLAPHTDHGLITILLQSYPGLQIKNSDDKWVKVPFSEGSSLVLLGDQMEVLSNGIYKSVIHQAVSSDQNRISIASINSFALEEKVRPAPLLVNEECESLYEECSFKDFLDFLSSSDHKQKRRFIDTLKKKNLVKGQA
ncbi:flavanone 3-dioxygenase 3-like [Neltuma alba]|uniref:flavanone 3-dioxygenase 3-like n=1 Tax=Neltuma alba TaxID=207710 RepID=UPI0010A44B4E|nr:flavanone 3-dioxygenase 3-like [Prosopis alba]